MLKSSRKNNDKEWPMAKQFIQPTHCSFLEFKLFQEGEKKKGKREKSLVWECTKLIIPHDKFPSLLSPFLDPPHT